MVSDRCNRYLATLERIPQTLSRQDIEAAIAAEDAPIFDPIVEFQLEFGGYVQMYGRNRFEWGILNSALALYSYFAPNEATYQYRGGEHCFTCCNCHGSDYWFLNESGTLHWCSLTPCSSSFAHKLERDAVVWDIQQQFPFFRHVDLELPTQDAIPLIQDRLQPGLIPEASDIYEALYLHRGAYAAIAGDRMSLFYLDDAAAEVLQDIPHKVADDLPTSPQKPPTVFQGLKQWWGKLFEF